MYSYANKKLLLESYSVISEMDENLVERVLLEAKDVSESKMDATIKVHKENMKAIEKLLKENKIDISSIKSAAKSVAEFAKKSFKKNIPVEKASKEVINSLGKKVIKKAVEKYEEMTTGQKIGNSVLLFIIIFLVNSIALQYLSIGLGKAAFFVLAVIIGPLVEEAAKKHAIVKKYPIVFNSIFAGAEALMYISKMVLRGVSLPKAIIIRAVGVCLHFSTLFIQMHYHKRAEKEIYQAEALERKGYLIAFTVHSLFNILGIIATVNEWI